MRTLAAVSWTITAIAACLSLLNFFNMLSESISAVQQAAGAAISVAMVVVPYVFSRAIETLATGSFNK